MKEAGDVNYQITKQALLKSINNPTNIDQNSTISAIKFLFISIRIFMYIPSLGDSSNLLTL